MDINFDQFNASTDGNRFDRDVGERFQRRIAEYRLDVAVVRCPSAASHAAVQQQ